MKLRLIPAVLLILLMLASCSAPSIKPRTDLPNTGMTDTVKTTEPADATITDTGKTSEPTDAATETADAKTLDLVFTLDEMGDGLPILSQKQAAFFENGSYDDIDKYCDAETEYSHPRYVKLKWNADGEKPDGLLYTVLVSENEDMSDARKLFCENKRSPYVLAYNLMPDTRYYWQVSAEADGRYAYSEVGSFTMGSAVPRPIFIDGVTNCREIGGWELAGGGRMKRGMVFRTAALNNNKTTEPRITEAGIDTMLNVLGVKTEIDLRGHLYDDGIMENGITESVLGSTVKYYFCPLEYGHDLKTDTDIICSVFKLFADESNYPLFFHCAIGTDRTGMIATVLEALLGVSEHDIYMDYVFSNFGKIADRNSMRLVNPDGSYLAQLRQYGGTTDSESARNYLISIGVTEDEIGEIIRILTE